MLARRPAFAEQVLALAALVAVLPLVLSIYATLCLLGEKPLFRQSRVGYLGRMFTILKFRTIPEGGWAEAEARGGRRARLRRRVSTALRATGLDELPQLWNVARGDMRLIGPRPLTVEDFRALPENRAARCRMHPGMTGLAQVNGGQALDAESKLLLDIYMIERASPAMYAGIVARSVARCIGLTRFVRSPDAALLRAARLHAALGGDAAETARARGRPSALTLTGRSEA